MRPYIKEECFSRSIFGTAAWCIDRPHGSNAHRRETTGGRNGHRRPGRITLSKQDSKTVIMADPIRFTKENIDQCDIGI